MIEKELKVRDAVEFVDTLGQSHKALITAVHGQYGHSCGTIKGADGKPVDAGQPSVNLLWVVDDDTKTDGHGRQIERASSVVHRGSQGAHGNFWEFLT